MIDHLSLVSRKIIALSLLLTTLIMLFIVVVAPVYGAFSARSETISQQLNNLVRYQKLTARKAAPLSGGNPDNGRPLANLLYAGETAALAAAELQRDIRERAARRGMSVLSSQALTNHLQGDFTRINIRVNVTATVGAFGGFLLDVGSFPRLIGFDNISIRMPENQPEGSQPEMSIQLDVYGFMEPPRT